MTQSLTKKFSHEIDELNVHIEHLNKIIQCKDDLIAIQAKLIKQLEAKPEPLSPGLCYPPNVREIDTPLPRITWPTTDPNVKLLNDLFPSPCSGESKTTPDIQ